MMLSSQSHDGMYSLYGQAIFDKSSLDKRSEMILLCKVQFIRSESSLDIHTIILNAVSSLFLDYLEHIITYLNTTMPRKLIIKFET